MATTSETPNMSNPSQGDKDKEMKVIGGRAAPPEIDLIDRAVLELRKQRPGRAYKRGHFMVEAAVEKARAVLKIQRAGDQAA